MIDKAESDKGKWEDCDKAAADPAANDQSLLKGRRFLGTGVSWFGYAHLKLIVLRVE